MLPPPSDFQKGNQKKEEKKGGKGKYERKIWTKTGEKQKVWSPFHNLDISRYLVGMNDKKQTYEWESIALQNTIH